SSASLIAACLARYGSPSGVSLWPERAATPAAIRSLIATTPVDWPTPYWNRLFALSGSLKINAVSATLPPHFTLRIIAASCVDSMLAMFFALLSLGRHDSTLPIVAYVNSGSAGSPLALTRFLPVRYWKQ